MPSATSTPARTPYAVHRHHRRSRVGQVVPARVPVAGLGHHRVRSVASQLKPVLVGASVDREVERADPPDRAGEVRIVHGQVGQACETRQPRGEQRGADPTETAGCARWPRRWSRTAVPAACIARSLGRTAVPGWARSHGLLLVGGRHRGASSLAPVGGAPPSRAALSRPCWPRRRAGQRPDSGGADRARCQNCTEPRGRPPCVTSPCSSAT